MPLVVFALVIFEIRSHVYAGAGLDLNLPIYASQVVGLKDVNHYTQLL
jgi:hypothetical protein